MKIIDEKAAVIEQLIQAVEWLLAHASWPTAKDARERGEPIPPYCPRPGSSG